MNSAHVSSLAAVVLGLAVVAAPTAAVAKTITVRPGESIQAAVNAAKAGDTVKVLSGDYIESNPGEAAVYIDKPLKLMASGHVRILADGGQPNGILVEGTPGAHVTGVEIVGFTVEGFEENGIWLKHVDRFNIENNVSINNLENGIWPTLSANGQVKNNVAYGSLDSALWVEASENVRVINNDLHHSPTGLEVTISKNLTIENNHVHDNTVGIGLYHPAAAGLDSPWPYEELGNWYVANNDVHDNNFENPSQGGETSALPPGIGLLLLGVDNVDVQRNRIEQNQYVGVGMLDWCVAVAGSGFDCTAETPDFLGSSVNNVRVTENKFAGNHALLGEVDGLFPPPSDILYVDGELFGLTPGVGNCQSGNKTIKTADHPGVLVDSFPYPLSGCD
jgi:parallel beta-helix repeat protein